MQNLRGIVLSVGLVLAASAISLIAFSAYNNKSEVATACSTQADVSIRLYYNPMAQGEGKAHSPCIFLPVSMEDPRLGTRSAWILYDELNDIQSVLRILSRQQLDWHESPARMRLVVEPFDLPQPQHTSMEVAVACPRGSAVAQVKKEQICPLLSEISKVLVNSTAKESFDFYRRSVSCEGQQ